MKKLLSLVIIILILQMKLELKEVSFLPKPPGLYMLPTHV